MNKNNWSHLILKSTVGLMLMHAAQAGSPVWTFEQVPENPSSITVSTSQTAIIKYIITNQSHHRHTLRMKPIQGITPSGCTDLLEYHQSCILTLTVNGNELNSDIRGGPVLCDKGNENECYQPNTGNELNITRSSAPPVDYQGHLQLSLNGNPVTSLSFQSGDSGTLILANTGLGNLSALNIMLPFGWQSYFTNNCPTQLQSQQQCTITYTIPTPAANGILNPLTIQAIHADNSLNIPVNIQVLGTAKCWGRNRFGQLGSTTNSGTTNPNTSPLNVQALNSDVVAIIEGYEHTCSLLNNGGVKCWGLNNFGQLGSTTNSDTNIPNDSPLDVQTLSSGAIAIIGGSNHTCALLDTGGMKCWGSNSAGQLGSTVNSGNFNANDSPFDVQTLSSGVIAMAAGERHTCALLNTKTVKCWGWNIYGQLGTSTNSGTNDPNNIPLDVQDLGSNVIDITAGDNHTCALLDTGAVKCWGENRYGQLGSIINIGTAIPNNSPLDVQTLSSGAIAIKAGQYHTCALMSTGAVKCWGSNYFGQLGSTINSGNFNSNPTPLDVQTLNTGVIAITGGDYHNCALMSTGAMKCWGLNDYGQLGSNTNSGTNNPNDSPLDVQTLTAGSTAALLNYNLGDVSCAIVY